MEYFFIRTDETILAENFIHKVFGIVLLAVVLAITKLSWSSIGFTKAKTAKNILKGLTLGASCFSIAYLAECILLYCMNGNVQLSVYASGFSLNGEAVKQNGIKVIPTIAWGGPETFWFCFDGIETKSIVAVSTLGVRNEKDLFMQGYNEMLRRIKPTKIICYGEPFSEMKGDIIEVDYAVANNLDKSIDSSAGYIKRSVGYVMPYVEKGMGSAGVGTATWANPNTLKDHFDRHAKAFSAQNELSYEQQAHRFYLERENYQIKIDDNGVIRVYDSSTNTFGVYNSNGKTITFFKPSHGQRYFDAQPGELK